jgi:hypothetical protein
MIIYFLFRRKMEINGSFMAIEMIKNKDLI